MKKRLLNLKKIGMSLIAVMLINTIAHSANFTAVASGNWSSSATWGGTAPSFTNTLDMITIPAGIVVTLDNNLTLNGATAVVSVIGTLSSSSTTALTVTMGSIAGTGTINIGDLTLGTSAALTFTGALAANTITSSTLNLQSSATVGVNQTLTLVAGTLSVQTGGVIALAANSNIVMAGGVLALNGGTLVLSNNYNVTYASSSNPITGLELSGSGLKNVTVNLPSSSNTLTLSTDLTVNGVLTLTNGMLALGLNNLIIAGEVATNGNGTISSNTTSDISINSSNGITGSLNFSEGAAVNNFTVNVGGANHAQIKGDLTVNGSFNLNSGTLMLDDTYLKLKGNISATGTGTIAATAASVITVNTLTSPLGAMRFGSSSVVKTFKVNIINGGSVKVGSDLFVQDTLNLTKGNLDIGTHHVHMVASSVITGADSNSYIITDATGSLFIPITAGNTTAKNFPVGTATKYFPASVSLNTGSTSGTVGIGVAQHVYDMGTTGTDLSTTRHIVDATWLIESDITANLNMNLNVMWSATAELNGFMRANAFISHFTNSTWDISASAIATLNANGMYGISRNNISSLSPYAVFDHTATGITEVTTAGANFDIYPNPATDIVYINNISATDIMTADVMNMTGQLIATYKLTEHNNSISLNGLNEGYYFVKLYNDKTMMVKKIVKM